MRPRETYRTDRRETVKEQARHSDPSLHTLWRASALRGEDNVNGMRAGVSKKQRKSPPKRAT